jgi:hypothetical protein
VAKTLEDALAFFRSKLAAVPSGGG